MEKHRLKNYLKIGILLFGISILAIACQKDDEFISRTQTETENNILLQASQPRGISVQTIDFGNAPHKN